MLKALIKSKLTIHLLLNYAVLLNLYSPPLDLYRIYLSICTILNHRILYFVNISIYETTTCSIFHHLNASRTFDCAISFLRYRKPSFIKAEGIGEYQQTNRRKRRTYHKRICKFLWKFCWKIWKKRLYLNYRFEINKNLKLINLFRNILF